MVYFLTEVTENDLLNTTSDNSETLPKNSAALESAIPTEESALPNNNSGTEAQQNEETEDTGETENTESTETTEPEQEAAEEPNPMVSYVLMGVLAVAFIGGAYYFFSSAELTILRLSARRKRTSSRMKMRTKKMKNTKTKKNRRKFPKMISLTRRRTSKDAVGNSGKAKRGTVHCRRNRGE